MKRLISLLMVATLLLTFCCGGLITSAQQQTKQSRIQPRLDTNDKRRARATLGPTPEMRAAWEKLSPEKRSEMNKKVRELVQAEIEKAKLKHENEPPATSLQSITFSDKNSVTQTVTAKTRESRKKAEDSSVQSRNVYPLTIQNYVSTATWKTIGQFINDFYVGALTRQPDTNEFNYWANRLIPAQSQGWQQLLAESQALGNSLFQSQEYANRGRTDPHDFVYDLYKGFLQREPDTSGWDFWTSMVPINGRPQVLLAFVVCFEFEHKVRMLANDSADADHDGFSEAFESQLSDLFRPIYFVSGGEPNNFARFANSTPQVPIQFFGPNPVSHYRVKPLGFAVDNNGLKYSLARIDYWTLWDRDDGFDYGLLCDFYIALTEDWGGLALIEFINSLSSHNLDNERSAVLVAARVEDNYFNPNPNEYKAYEYYLGAHENSIGDQSVFLQPYPAVPADWHLWMYLAKGKHGTYYFNPDYLPLVPWWIQDATFFALFLAYYYGWIDYWTYEFYSNSAANVFYNCVVEHFSDVGGRDTNPRINVGEPNFPINQSDFIRVPELTNKMNASLW